MKISKKYGIPQYNKFNNLLLPSENITKENKKDNKISFHNKYFIPLKNDDEDENDSESKSENNDKISFHNKYFISLKKDDGDEDEEDDESNSNQNQKILMKNN